MLLTRTESTVWSNVVFLAPISFGIALGDILHAAITASTAIASVHYHISNEQRGQMADRVCAWLLVVANVSLLAAAHFPVLPTGLALAIAGLALHRLWALKRDDWLWHTLAGLVCVVCLAAGRGMQAVDLGRSSWG